MQEQMQNIMDTIVMPVMASVGGFAGIIAILTAVAKVIASAKSGKKAVAISTETKKEVSALLGNLSAEFQAELERRLNCQFKVDFSAKLNEELKGLEERFVGTSERQARELAAMKVMMSDIATMYTTSRNITEEERLTLLEHIAAVNALFTEPKKEVPPPQDVVVIEYKPTEAQPKAEVATPTVKGAEAKAATLRGI